MTKAFLGMSITCAHCHNHPLEKWTQNDYFSMANLFARVRLKTGNFSRTRRALEDVTVFSSTTGDIIRSEEHTSELQSRSDLVCRLLLEKKKPTAVAAAC